MTDVPITVTLASSHAQDVTVDIEMTGLQGWRSNNKSATPNIDFKEEALPFTFPAETTTQIINASVLGDTRWEDDERFLVRVVAASIPLYEGSGGEFEIQRFFQIINDD